MSENKLLNLVDKILDQEKYSLDEVELIKVVHQLWSIRDLYVEDGATAPIISALVNLTDIPVEEASKAVDSYYEEEIG
tara:strand:+ start:560 stop:793 length:234 start_codon:yes stop_codon:yes gene_type:complete